MYVNTFGQNYNKLNNSDKLEYITISNLIPNTIYQIRLRARCKTGSVYKNGAWSGTYTTSTPLRLEEISPIINDNILYIYDIYGRLIYHSLDIPTDFSSYINGIYFFKINNVVTKKMIIN